MLNHQEREKVKATYRPIMEDVDMPMLYRFQAANNILKVLFFRSCEAYLSTKEYPKDDNPEYYACLFGHPWFGLYKKMLLNQGAKALSFPEDVYNLLVKTEGKCTGISKGTYYTGKEVSNIE